MYSNISYGVEIYDSCSYTSLDRLQVMKNKLLKLLLRLDPYTSTNLLHSDLNILKVKDLYNTSVTVFNFAFCFIISSCPNHVEVNLKAASFDKLTVVSLAAIKWYIYLWIQIELFICQNVLLMCMYVHFLEIKYQSINQSIS